MLFLHRVRIPERANFFLPTMREFLAVCALIFSPSAHLRWLQVNGPSSERTIEMIELGGEFVPPLAQC